MKSRGRETAADSGTDLVRQRERHGGEETGHSDEEQGPIRGEEGRRGGSEGGERLHTHTRMLIH